MKNSSIHNNFQHPYVDRAKCSLILETKCEKLRFKFVKFDIEDEGNFQKYQIIENNLLKPNF